MSKLIDIEACKEFMQETLEKIDRDDLVSMAGELVKKSELFQEKLAKERILSLTDEELKELMKQIFLIRRKGKVLFENYSFDQYKAAIYQLLYSEEQIENRFKGFVEHFPELKEEWVYDMAGEFLHYTFPEKYWLWNRWLFDPNTNTGALLLVTEEFELKNEDFGKMYMNVGKAIAFVHSMAESVEFQFIHRELFGTDVFLACVYVIYAYTVLKIKMTDEFNKVMPGMGEFSRRILGIYHSKEMTVV